MARHRYLKRVTALAMAALVGVVNLGGSGTAQAGQTFDPATDPGSLSSIVRAIGADDLWAKGWTGAGVDVAVIDSGISPVPALEAPGKVMNGPDLSFDSTNPALATLDGFGHGTHMAGIIAGRRGTGRPSTTDPSRFLGIAPDARIINIKAGDNTGAVDVSQVIAALDWVVQRGDRDGLNIRVVNLSFGTQGIQPYEIDPLARAVENAWNDGIVVVVAAGNDGRAVVGMANPASDPFVISVGPAERTSTGWTVPSFATNGNGVRNPDLVAPGRSVASLRVPGSRIDVEYPSARVGKDLFRGSGSSQAAAVVSGAAALLLQQRPALTPNQVKALLKTTADRLPGVGSDRQGNGLLDVDEASRIAVPWFTAQIFLPSTGLGLLELSRGLDHVSIDGRIVQGEVTVWGTSFLPSLWLATSGTSSWSGGSWSGGSWSGGSWSGAGWS